MIMVNCVAPDPKKSDLFGNNDYFLSITGTTQPGNGRTLDAQNTLQDKTRALGNLPSPACAVTNFIRFYAQLSAWQKSAGHDEARSPAHFKCFEIMPAIFSMSTLRTTCLCPKPLASSILHTQYSVFSTRENEDCPPNLHLQHRVGARPIVINASVKTTAQAQDDHRNKQNQVCFLHAPVS